LGGGTGPPGRASRRRRCSDVSAPDNAWYSATKRHVTVPEIGRDVSRRAFRRKAKGFAEYGASGCPPAWTNPAAAASKQWDAIGGRAQTVRVIGDSPSDVGGFAQGGAACSSSGECRRRPDRPPGRCASGAHAGRRIWAGELRRRGGSRVIAGSSRADPKRLARILTAICTSRNTPGVRYMHSRIDTNRSRSRSIRRSALGHLRLAWFGIQNLLRRRGPRHFRKCAAGRRFGGRQGGFPALGKKTSLIPDIRGGGRRACRWQR